jgi:hypothetical protein
MAKLNLAGCGHGNKSEAYTGGIVVHYNAFPNSTPADRLRVTKVQKAFDIVNKVDKRINLANTCNVYFKALPKGKSFRDFWRDPTIFINYDPTPGANAYGDTHSNDKDIALHRWCTDTKNVWTIAATIVHEFAHIGGAPGWPSPAAEQALPKCGFGLQYDPAILGSIESVAQMLARMA